MKSYDYFSEQELRCKCGECKGGEMDTAFMERLTFIREFVGIPMNISSGFRCPDYNTQVSHSGRTGPHTTGRAVDVRVSGKEAHAITKAAMQCGMTGIGIAQRGNHGARFIHLDDLDGDTRPWIWGY